MFPLSGAVLLVSMRARHIMFNAYATEERFELFILPSLVTLDCQDFSVKVSFNKFLELLKYRENFRFVLDQINPTKLAIVINETDILFFPSKRISGMTPYITKDKFQRSMRNTN